MMNRAAPTQALPYIAHLFRPLDELLHRAREVCEAESGEAASKVVFGMLSGQGGVDGGSQGASNRESHIVAARISGLLEQWARRVVERAASTLEQHAGQMLEQQETSFRSLQRVARQAGSLGDLEKMHAQVQRDVDEFLTQVREKYAISDTKVIVRPLSQGE